MQVILYMNAQFTCWIGYINTCILILDGVSVFLSNPPPPILFFYLWLASKVLLANWL